MGKDETHFEHPLEVYDSGIANGLENGDLRELNKRQLTAMVRKRLGSRP